jgi:oxygen-independent coproporphyrinogen-3 oxidase
MKEAGIYVHIPFCKSRCRYCDFNTSAGMEHFIPEYFSSLEKEIKIYGERYASLYAIRSIYAGGGTPSYLAAGTIPRVIQEIKRSFHVTTDVEISVEANPADITMEKCREWIHAGVRRMSIGMQSAQKGELQMLGRRHCFADVVRVVEQVRSAGMTNFNLDLMFGLPHQSMKDWQDSVKKAMLLQPAHLSLYALTVEEGTPLAIDMDAGLLPAPDDDLAADMYEWATDFLATQGFEQYEISNWAKQDGVNYHCQHNLLYWRNQDYFGFGASAHSHFGARRWANLNGIQPYVKGIALYSAVEEAGFPWLETNTALSVADDMGETAMMGLRQTQEGLRDDLFQERFGISLFRVYEKQIAELVDIGLLEVVSGDMSAIRLTKRGRMVGNQVFLRFLMV